MDPPPRGEAPEFLQALAAGQSGASDRLLELVYGELRRLAGGVLSGERAGHTLQPTAPVHEARVLLVDQESVEWQNRAHFLGSASLAGAGYWRQICRNDPISRPVLSSELRSNPSFAGLVARNPRGFTAVRQSPGARQARREPGP